MLRKKIMIVFGTRPEAIKMAPLIRMIKNYSNSYQLIVCVTGQHREMLDQVLDIFCIKPDIDLGIMTPNQSLSEITSSILTNIDSILKKENPNLVLVHGDTTTTLATSLACFYNKIKVGHVEAGLELLIFTLLFQKNLTDKLLQRFVISTLLQPLKAKKIL